ncbi:MAG: U32 family peptidase [Bacilli bacterium]|nr:U32 family peptidase [Bacilli bacterium]
MTNKVELLAPAGDLERLKIALKYGADAVYIGGPLLTMRANAVNFTMDEIKEGAKFAHSLGKKIYVTVNIIPHNENLDEITIYLKKLEECNIDAIIASDPAVINEALTKTNLEVHLSTQASALNTEAVKFWKEQGISRVVLGRECTKEEIKEIIDNVDIEIETFIHGAMCAGYSGRCVMSNFLTNRDANRGGCSQICRWDFDLLNEDKEKLEGDKPFTFCSKDLSMLKYLPEMIDMGITSLKIEGRMRSAYYIATIVSIYRKVIDEYCNDKVNYTYNKEYERVLRRCANRDSVPQFFNGIYDSSCSYYNGRVEVSNQDFLGIVLDYDKEKRIATIEQRNYFKKGDIVEIFGSNHNIITYKLNKIYDEDDNLIEIVRHPRQVVKIEIEDALEKDDMIRIKCVDKSENM